MLTFLPDFLISRFSKKKPCFDILPNDVLVDDILIHLGVRDILSVRRVCKLFYHLTQSPIIWKRFLRVLNIPISPLPPTPRYSLANIDLDAERTVIRALSLDENWRSHKPQAFRSQKFKTYSEILEMILLPGGKYLVASVRDPGHKYYAIMVFILDHSSGNPVALAKNSVKTRAYGLRARYTTIGSIQGITVAYCRREYSRKAHRHAGLDPSDFSVKHDIDFSRPVRHEAVCLQISLVALELLGDTKFSPGTSDFYEHALRQKPPFKEITRPVRAVSRLDNLNLVEFDGVTHLSLIKRVEDGPESILFQNLTTGKTSILRCAPYEPYSDFNHTIRGLRTIPSQNQAIVIREIDVPDETTSSPIYVFEMFDIPMTGETVDSQPASEPFIIDDREITDFEISEHASPYNDNSIQPTLLANQGAPPPISIFCQTINPHGILHYVAWPRRFDVPSHSGPQTVYQYSLQDITFQSQYDSSFSDGLRIMNVLPGAYRSLMYFTPADDRTHCPPLLGLKRYINPETVPSDFTEEKYGPQSILSRKRKGIPAAIYKTLELPEYLETALHNDGVRAVAWDEGLGRVCIAAAKHHTIHFMDFAGPKSLHQKED